MAKIKVHLKKEEREALKKFVASGKRSAREINRARILLLTDEGKKDKEIILTLGVSRKTVYNTRKKYNKEKEYIINILKDQPRSGRPVEIDSRVQANITMLACSEPPKGTSRWTLNMIADKLVELDVTDSISHESVRKTLKKTN